jgi:nudix-type nucleoside diphosphatase (YffH/AdpP family)
MPEETVRIVRTELLSDNYYPLKNVTYEQRRSDGSWQEQLREVYDNASGAAALLYNPRRGTVLLTRQFRVGARLAGDDGFLLEVAAGNLDGAPPEERIRAEIGEELGYRIKGVEKVLELFASPGSLTERVHYYLAQYDDADRCGPGGGKKDEGEDIAVLELPFEDTLAMVARGEIRDTKTVVLLQYLKLRQLAGAQADGA